MSASLPVSVAIMGCSNIAGPYARDPARYPWLRLVGAADLEPARAVIFMEHALLETQS